MADSLIPANAGLFNYFANSGASPTTGTLDLIPALVDGIKNVSIINSDYAYDGDGGVGIDLGAVYLVARLIFYDYNSPEQGMAPTTDQCRIYSSNNNANWTLVEAFDPISRADGGSSTVGSITLDFTVPTAARYFKMMQPGPGASFYTALGNFLRWSEVEAYGVVVPPESSNILSDARIVNPHVFTYAISETILTNDINVETFDIKLKHPCSHQLLTGTYKLSTCLRCLGTGYYYDIKFDALGRAIEVSLEDKLQQALEKLVLTERNDFHSDIAVNLKKWLGNSPLNSVQAIIKYELIKGIATLQQNQLSVANLSSRAIISTVDSIDVTQSGVDRLNYVVSITTVSGTQYNLVGTINLNNS